MYSSVSSGTILFGTWLSIKIAGHLYFCVSHFTINHRNENNTANDTSTYFKTCCRSIIFEAEVINDNMAILTGWEKSVDVEQN